MIIIHANTDKDFYLYLGNIWVSIKNVDQKRNNFQNKEIIVQVEKNKIIKKSRSKYTHVAITNLFNNFFFRHVM